MFPNMREETCTISGVCEPLVRRDDIPTERACPAEGTSADIDATACFGRQRSNQRLHQGQLAADGGAVIINDQNWAVLKRRWTSILLGATGSTAKLARYGADPMPKQEAITRDGAKISIPWGQMSF